MESKWLVHSKKADFKAIGEKYGIDQVIARIIRNRDVLDDKNIDLYLNGSIDDCHNPRSMKDLVKAVEILINKINSEKKIRVIGDYDIDGICSTCILYKGIKACKGLVDYAVPHRVLDGYGININMIEQAIEDGVDTIITCDNGIAAFEQVEFAKEHGLTVIITDHHDIPFEESEGIKKYRIPRADAVVDPKQTDCEYPFDKLCGAGVAFKLIKVLYEELNMDLMDLEDLAELMAIATVGDVVDLVDENRIIVKYGLHHISVTKNIGLLALIEACELNPENISAYHIGFIIGPCLNASGRLDTAKASIELFLCDSKQEACKRAEVLQAYNQERKDITERFAAEAIELVEESELADDKVLVVYIPECHESVAGIIAGRIRERFYKPSIVLTNGEDGVKGSGRSIEGYNMFEEINKHKELLDKFGGHPMAAGMSLQEANIDAFRKALNESQTMTEDILTPKIMIDVPMPVDYVTLGLIEQFSLLEPFGKGNEKPIFADRNLLIKRASIIGKNRNVFKCTLESQYGKLVDAIMFNVNEEAVPKVGDRISMVYYPDVNEFRGNVSTQFVIKEWKLTE